MPTTLVTGGTGTTGRLVAALLRRQGATARTAGRSRAADVRFDWTDPATHGPAVAGADRVYLVAPTGEPDPAALVEPFLGTALRAGVRRVVLLSSSAVEPGDPGLGQVDSLVRERAPQWAVLRPSWFQQNVTGDHPVARSLREEDRVVTATGTGRVALVDARDIAAVAVRALLDEPSHDTEHVLTGPQALSWSDVADLVSAARGRAARHEPVGVDELARRWVAAGLPEPFARALAALDEDISLGRHDVTTDTVRRVTGRDPRALADLLAEHFGAHAA
ncbi:NAD(P)H-binding protein [Kineococcus sp. SYSU DK002]|uniref:NAD(P)H-binding protein n=1 Tax=Kineococcus sp. SYSU DK002 TaxID=3383123 RepID=UPI003D7CC639